MTTLDDMPEHPLVTDMENEVRDIEAQRAAVLADLLKIVHYGPLPAHEGSCGPAAGKKCRSRTANSSVPCAGLCGIAQTPKANVVQLCAQFL